MRIQSLGREDPLERQTAIHSSILAWRIPMDRGVWQATVHGVTKLDMTEATEHTRTYDKGYKTVCLYSLFAVCLLLCVLVAQSCPTLCDPKGCCLPGSSVHVILQARILKWVAISFSRGSS